MTSKKSPGEPASIASGELSKGTKHVESLRKGLDVLRAIHEASAITFTDLQRATGVPKATLVRILKTLVASGWIHRNESNGRYMAELAGHANRLKMPAAHEKLGNAAYPFRLALQKRVPWPIDMAVRDGSHMLIIEGPDSGLQSIAANYRLLGFRPSMLRSSLGRCYLSFCPKDERDAIVSALSHSTDPSDRAALAADSLKRLVAQTKAHGYALRDASHTPLTSPERYGAIAVPIFNGDTLVACLSCSWHPELASTPDIVSNYLRHMQDAAKAIGREYGS